MNALDVIGRQFGGLTVLAYIGGPRALRLCRCSCGRDIKVSITRLRDGGQQFCRRCSYKRLPGRPVGSQDVRDTANDLVLAELLSNGPGLVKDLARRSGLPLSTVSMCAIRLHSRQQARIIDHVSINGKRKARVYAAVTSAAR